jgi:phage terminase small subunit
MTQTAEKKLTTKQALFVEHLCDPDVNFNASEAYRRAGYTGKDANNNAYKILTNSHIKEEVERRQRELLARAKKNTEVNFDWKMNMLRDSAIMTFEAGEVAPIRGLINEMNKMQGDHVAEKKEVTTINLDFAVQVSDKYLEEF